MNTYHFHVEITADYPWTVEDVEIAFRATFPATIEGLELQGGGVRVRPFELDHPSLAGYRHGHLTQLDQSSNVSDEEGRAA